MYDPIIAQLMDPTSVVEVSTPSEEKKETDNCKHQGYRFNYKFDATQDDCGGDTKHQLHWQSSSDKCRNFLIIRKTNRLSWDEEAFVSRNHDQVKCKLEGIFSQFSDSPK